MSWELYEVMATDERGHQSLYYATKSLKEARQMALQALKEGHVYAEVIGKPKMETVSRSMLAVQGPLSSCLVRAADS